MIATWGMYFMMSCAEPRMPFRDFFAARNGFAKYERQMSPWTVPRLRPNWFAMYGENAQTVIQRAADTSADYMDYVVTYNEQCVKPK